MKVTCPWCLKELDTTTDSYRKVKGPAGDTYWHILCANNANEQGEAYDAYADQKRQQGYSMRYAARRTFKSPRRRKA